MTSIEFGKNGLPDLGNFFKIIDYQPRKKQLDAFLQKVSTIDTDELHKPFGTELDLTLNNSPEIIKLKHALYKMDSEDLDRKCGANLTDLDDFKPDENEHFIKDPIFLGVDGIDDSDWETKNEFTERLARQSIGRNFLGTNVKMSNEHFGRDF